MTETTTDTPRDQVVSPWMIVLVALVAALATVAAAAGVFLRGDLATEPFTTVRGDTVDTLLGGVYQYNGKPIAAEGVGWDAVTLFLVIPALLLTLPFLRRGSLRARLFTAGILAYFVYQYFEYAMALAYGPFFAVYVGIGALSLTGLAVIIGGLDLGQVRSRVSERFPRRAMTGFGVFMAVLLAGMWLPLIARTFGAAEVPELNGGTTLVVQAFDLGFLVPLGLFTAVTVHRRLAVGYVLSSIVVVKGMAMGAGIASMMVVEWSATGVSQLPPIVVFSLISLGCAVLAVRVFGSIGPLEVAPGDATLDPVAELRAPALAGGGGTNAG
jgi:hypothetical protein